MPDTIKTGTILIKDGTLLPEALRFESQSSVPGWRLIKDLDGYGLDREIRAAGWTFLYLALETKATVFGIDEQKMIRRAVDQVLANPNFERFNSLEITRVASVSSERFPGIRYITVSAHPRQIQESLFLFCAKDLPQLETAKSGGLNQNSGLASGETLPPYQEPKQTSVEDPDCVIA
jgi:hypothetical protein